jgi:pyruvate-formate lyase-activating enzyme
LDETIPFHILAFFPQYKLKDFRAPTLGEIIETYQLVKSVGLKEVRIGNVGIITKDDKEMKKLLKIVGVQAL